MQGKKENMVVCILFALLLYGGFLLCLFMPRPRYLESERRTPAAVPVLTGDALWSGRFMTDFEDYGMDAFPFRDFFAA